MDRCWTFGAEHYTAVPFDGPVTYRLVLRTARRERTESRTDAALGRAVHTDALLRRHQNDRCALEARLHRQSEAGPATTATDGARSDLSKTEPVITLVFTSVFLAGPLIPAIRTALDRSYFSFKKTPFVRNC